jgi:hypothetical protein
MRKQSLRKPISEILMFFYRIRCFFSISQPPDRPSGKSFPDALIPGQFVRNSISGCIDGKPSIRKSISGCIDGKQSIRKSISEILMFFYRNRCFFSISHPPDRPIRKSFPDALIPGQFVRNSIHGESMGKQKIETPYSTPSPGKVREADCLEVGALGTAHVTFHSLFAPLWWAVGGSGKLKETMGGSGNFRNPPGTFWSIWKHLGAPRNIWGQLGTSGNIWERRGESGHNWKHLRASESLWEHLGISGNICEHLGASGSTWYPQG